MPDEARNFGTGPHEGHVTPDDVHELREFIELPGPEESSYPGDSRVGSNRQLAAYPLRVYPHGPQLQDVERDAPSPHPLLSEQHGARRVDFDGDRRRE